MVSTSTVREEQENDYTRTVGQRRVPKLWSCNSHFQNNARPSGVANGSKGEKQEQKALDDLGDEIDADDEINSAFIA